MKQPNILRYMLLLALCMLLEGCGYTVLKKSPRWDTHRKRTPPAGKVEENIQSPPQISREEQEAFNTAMLDSLYGEWQGEALGYEFGSVSHTDTFDSIRFNRDSTCALTMNFETYHGNWHASFFKESGTGNTRVSLKLTWLDVPERSPWFLYLAYYSGTYSEGRMHFSTSAGPHFAEYKLHLRRIEQTNH